jgi:CysZ protein
MASTRSLSIFAALALAIGQLGDPRLRAPLFKSIGLSLATLVVLWIGLGYGLLHTQFFAIAWLDGTLAAIGGFGVILLTIILFPSFVAAFLGLFLEAVAQAVEARHFPQLPPAKTRSTAAEILAGLRLVGLALAINLLVLPLYFVPGLNMAVFLAANGFLLAAEYGGQGLARRAEAPAIAALWRKHRGQAWRAGAIFAGLSLVPIVNLAVPVIAVAACTHLVESWLRVGTETGHRG